ncbi:ABC transporter ATP-binding protein [Caldivirga sp.]|uniref:ABC transporter ATP-binding protein n=1 Tax=Caldivirga sp. TaxID=2080243 RepID=UPI0025C688A3|nr:ABC transporter ATP-binding protein [Caldivirga sp.]
MSAVEAVDLRKSFISYERIGLIRRRKVRVNALNGVSINIKWGEVYGLLGPNGAGKTTTVKILSTLLIPDSGLARVSGFDIVKEARKVRGTIGLVLYPDKGFYSRLSGFENLVYFGRLYGLSRMKAEERARELLRLVNLDWASNRPYEEYSLGMRARLSIARALIHDPPVVFLDEPTIGLDPVSARSIRSLIKSLKKEGRAILLTSHNLWEVEEVCDRVGIISEGKVLVEGSPRDIKDKLGLRYVIEAEVNGDSGSSVIRVETTDPVAELRRIMLETEGNGLRIIRIRVNEPTLEEAYIKVVSK